MTYICDACINRDYVAMHLVASRYLEVDGSMPRVHPLQWQHIPYRCTTHSVFYQVSLGASLQLALNAFPFNFAPNCVTHLASHTKWATLSSNPEAPCHPYSINPRSANTIWMTAAIVYIMFMKTLSYFECDRLCENTGARWVSAASRCIRSNIRMSPYATSTWIVQTAHDACVYAQHCGSNWWQLPKTRAKAPINTHRNNLSPLRAKCDRWSKLNQAIYHRQYVHTHA